MFSSIRVCLSKFIVWKGQASRSEFIDFLLFYIVMLILGGFLDTTLSTRSMSGYENFWLFIFLGVFSVPMLAVTFRRLKYIGEPFIVVPVYIAMGIVLREALTDALRELWLETFLSLSIFFPHNILYIVESIAYNLWLCIPFILVLLPLALFCMRKTPQDDANIAMANEEAEENAENTQHTNEEGLLQAPALGTTQAEKITASASSHAAHDTFCKPYSGKIRHGKDGDLKDAL